MLFRSVEFERASRLLRSPFLGGAESELAARAQLDARLRRDAPARTSLPKLIARIDHCPLLRARLEAAGRLDGLVVASPANPTGTMLGAAELSALGEWCARRGVRLVSDEIYHGIVYGDPAATAAGLAPDAIVVNSFSKYFAMTGWRLGWMVVPPDLLRPVEVLAQNFFISPPALSQAAALAAFEACEELDANVARYRRNRDLLLAELPRVGFDRFASPDGAFYLYADVAHLTNDSSEFCKRMLREAGVAATPGVDFDRARGNSYLRFSFAGSEADMAEAVRRLAAWRRD